MEALAEYYREHTTTCILASFGLIAVTIYLVQKLFDGGKNEPPGMISIPIFGTLPFLGKKFSTEPFLEFSKLAKKYGNVFSMKIGSGYTVIVHGNDLIREALIKNAEDFSDRPQNALADVYNPNYNGIFDAKYNEAFRERRKHALVSLRNFGFGKRSLWDSISQEAEHLLISIKDKRDKDGCFKPHDFFNVSVANVICSMVFGRRFTVDEPEFIKVHGAIGNLVGLFGNVHGGTVIPAMRLLPSWKKWIKGFMKTYGEIMDFITEEIQQHTDTLDESNPRDFIDTFLIEQKNDPTNKNKSMEELKSTVLDFFTAGTETTATTLKWTLIYLVNNPTVQKKLYKEIESILGESRSPNIEDKNRMPYTEAVINEVLRQSSFIPIHFHSTSRDTTLGGYHIRKDSQVLFNVWDVHKDPANWEDPDQFKPERFINENGQFVKNEKMLIFSIGRRMCLGEQLAKVEVFTFLTKLVQAFEFKAPAGSEKVTEEAGLNAFIRYPTCDYLQAVIR